jgi:hypothetical protein
VDIHILNPDPLPLHAEIISHAPQIFDSILYLSMPPKQIPPAASVPNPPGAVNPATAAAIAAVAASTAAAAKKAPLKRKSSTGSTDSKTTAKRKKTSVNAAMPGAAKAAATAKAKDDKKKVTPKSPVAVNTSTTVSTAAKTATKSASPPKSTTAKAKPKPTVTVPTQQSKSQKTQQIKRDLANLDSIEKAFKQDREVWCPTEPSGGWMYRTGAAGLGAQSYMKAVNDANPPREGILFDETALLQNALRYNNLTVDSLTPQAYTALLEQARRYALELLVDAQDYAQHASRSTVASLTPSDLTLAAEMRGDMNGIPSTLPKFEEMAEYASEMNKKPLPPVPADCYNGVSLPPPEEQLTCRTFDVVNGARITQKMINGGDLPLSTVDVGLVRRSSNVEPILAKKTDGTETKRASKTQGAHGAGKGRQIAIHLKGSGASLSAKKAEGTKVAQSKSEPKNKRKLTEL